MCFVVIMANETSFLHGDFIKPYTKQEPQVRHFPSLTEQSLKEELKGKSRMYLEKISLDLEEEKELGMQLG
jgi:hypothetical protein